MFYCRTPHYYVVLDLARDRYFTLEAERVDPAGGLLAYSQLARALGPPVLMRPAANLVPTVPANRFRIRLSTVARFLRSALWAAWRLKTGALQQTVEIVERRKQAHAAAPVPFDFDRARALVFAFEKFRPWFPRNYRCLFDSLALLDFLAVHTLFPTWVFGVREEPFESHCWVQAEGVVLNDTLECVSAFTPILAV